MAIKKKVFHLWGTLPDTLYMYSVWNRKKNFLKQAVTLICTKNTTLCYKHRNYWKYSTSTETYSSKKCVDTFVYLCKLPRYLILMYNSKTSGHRKLLAPLNSSRKNRLKTYSNNHFTVPFTVIAVLLRKYQFWSTLYIVVIFC